MRVGQRDNSVPGTFRLDVFVPEPTPRGPGAVVPLADVTGRVDALQNLADAYSSSLRAGDSYRINLSRGKGEPCVSLTLYPPGIRVFADARPVRRLRCGGYLLFTPRAGEGGRYVLRVAAAARVRGPQPYRVQVARAATDDIAPGRFLANGVAGNEEVARVLRPGRYFAAVRAEAPRRGTYRLQRVTRTVTRTSIAAPRRVRSGRNLAFTVRVRPAVDGPALVTLQRFDPLAGYQFLREARVRVVDGVARLPFTPPAIGRYRATASFEGTRGAAPSQAGCASVLVADPLSPE